MKSRLVMFLAVALAAVAVGGAVEPPGRVSPSPPAGGARHPGPRPGRLPGRLRARGAA